MLHLVISIYDEGANPVSSPLWPPRARGCGIAAVDLFRVVLGVRHLTEQASP
jgi:hypothetical protein